MSELQDMLRVQARLHREQGANALGDLFENANGEIETLRTQLEKANERVKELVREASKLEDNLEKVNIGAGFLEDEFHKANDRVKGLELTVKGFKEFIAVARVMFLDLDEMEVNSKEYTDLLSDLFMLFCGGDEFHKYVKKFAIDMKLEVLDEVESVYIQAAETSEPISFREAFDTVEEQLRKEKASE